MNFLMSYNDLKYEVLYTPTVSPPTTSSQPQVTPPSTSQQQPITETIIEPITEPIPESPITDPTTSSPPQYETTTSHSPTMPCDLPLLGGYTPRSDEGRMKLNELTELCITLSEQVRKLEDKLNSKRRRVQVVTSEDEEDITVEDPSKVRSLTDAEVQGRQYDEDFDFDSTFEEGFPSPSKRAKGIVGNYI
ncbi:hypothetical protein Tco_0986893 [Tanacetum coccineum]